MKESLKKEFNFIFLLLGCCAALVLVWKIWVLAIIFLIAPTIAAVYLRQVSFNKLKYNSNQIRSACLSVSVVCALFILFSKGKVTASVCRYFMKGHVYSTAMTTSNDDGEEYEEHWLSFQPKDKSFQPLADAVSWVLLISIVAFPGFNLWLYNKSDDDIE